LIYFWGRTATNHGQGKNEILPRDRCFAYPARAGIYRYEPSAIAESADGKGADWMEKVSDEQYLAK
jgi:hypothetical protein